MGNTEPNYTPDIYKASAAQVHTTCTKALIHKTSVAEISLFRVAVGGEIASHHHSTVWDFFVGMSGEGCIEVTTCAGDSNSFPLVKDSHLAMPPDVTHTVRNLGEEDFVFLLTHAPFEGYDHIPG